MSCCKGSKSVLGQWEGVLLANEDRKHGEAALMKGVFKVMLWVACACAVAACGGPNNKEKQVIAEMTRDIRTDCIGRMLIDVPKSFKWSHAPSVTLYYGT